MATATAPAPISTVWRTGSRKDTVATRNSRSPAKSTNTTGNSALSCQLKRTELSSKSSTCDEPADADAADNEPADEEPTDIVRSLPAGRCRAAALGLTVSAKGPVRF